MLKSPWDNRRPTERTFQMANNTEEDKSVTLFREYLRIRSDHPKPDYAASTQFFQKLAQQYGFQFEVVEMSPGRPIVLMTWEGQDPTLPTILLNSHVDVVPAELNKWKCDPFAATKDAEGNIFGRGTQDMKSVTIQHIEAVGRLKNSGTKLLRTVHFMIVPDEETGGKEGMALFVESERFRKLNIGVTLDEGLASDGEPFVVFYGERASWWVRIKAVGPTGHGSRFVENPAMEKLIRVVNKLLAFRKEQFDTLQRGQSECGMKLGDVTTLNLTVLKGGVTHDGGKSYSYNVVPSEAEAGFDIRIPPTVDLKEFEKQLQEWTNEEGVSFEFVTKTETNNPSDISEDSKWWQAFKSACEKTGAKLDPQIFPAATDSRYIRDKMIPAFGFSPMNFTPTLLHDHNEFLNEKIFLKGIDIFESVVKDLANAKF